jgi:Skp family chaperone for outer membrane proteins
MAPEQADRSFGDVGPHSDQYALGVVLYELLCGDTPFSGPPNIVIYNLVHQDPAPPSKNNPGVPKDLETICLKAMAKRPTDRYADCGAMSDDLRRFLIDEPILARRLGPIERLSRWYRRNTAVALAGGSALFLLLVAGIISIGYWTQSAARSQAVLAGRQAEERYRQAEALWQEAVRELEHTRAELSNAEAELRAAESRVASARTEQEKAEAQKAVAEAQARLATAQAELAGSRVEQLNAEMQVAAAAVQDAGVAPSGPNSQPAPDASEPPAATNEIGVPAAAAFLPVRRPTAIEIAINRQVAINFLTASRGGVWLSPVDRILKWNYESERTGVWDAKYLPPGPFVVIGAHVRPTHAELDAQQFASCSYLQSLIFFGEGVTDAALSNVSRMGNLRKVFCPAQPSVTDAGVRHIPGASQLNYLVISSPLLTDKSCEYLSRCRRLRFLAVDGNFSDAGIRHLADLTELAWLSVGFNDLNMQVSPDGWKPLARLKKLRILHVDSLPHLWDAHSLTQFSDAHLEGLTEMTQLSELGLAKTNISDAAVDTLAEFHSLRKLDLCGTQITEAGWNRLKDALPGCEISRPDSTTLICSPGNLSNAPAWGAD